MCRRPLRANPQEEKCPAEAGSSLQEWIALERESGRRASRSCASR
jgi:hypothetical protein